VGLWRWSKLNIKRLPVHCHGPFLAPFSVSLALFLRRLCDPAASGSATGDDPTTVHQQRSLSCGEHLGRYCVGRAVDTET